MSGERVTVRQNVMKANDEIAAAIRRRLDDARTCSLNLISSPGSGKTTLLERTAERLKDRWSLAVVAGDVQTDRDAERLRKYGVPVYAIETGGSCHLDARQVASVLEPLDPRGIDLLLIENVGNLVCPSAYDLGESMKVVLVSVAEGDDKPLKYPAIFRRAGALVVTKIDLAPYVRASVPRIVDHARSYRWDLPVFPTSSYTGEGLEDWIAWISARVAEHKERAVGAGAER